MAFFRKTQTSREVLARLVWLGLGRALSRLKVSDERFGLKWTLTNRYVAFGIKHVARELAEKAGVPIVPGTKGLVTSEDDALKESERLGYPVMLKATAGGGGMGLVVCDKAEDVKEGFRMVQSRGTTKTSHGSRALTKYRPDIVQKRRLIHRKVLPGKSSYRSPGLWQWSRRCDSFRRTRMLYPAKKSKSH